MAVGDGLVLDWLVSQDVDGLYSGADLVTPERFGMLKNQQHVNLLEIRLKAGAKRPASPRARPLPLPPLLPARSTSANCCSLVDMCC